MKLIINDVARVACKLTYTGAAILNNYLECRVDKCMKQHIDEYTQELDCEFAEGSPACCCDDTKRYEKGDIYECYLSDIFDIWGESAYYNKWAMDFGNYFENGEITLTETGMED